MNVLLVHAHPEPNSFNGAMTGAACAALRAAGHAVALSDLYAMGFDAASRRTNFTSVRDPEFLSLQREELHASKVGGFVEVIESEIRKLEQCELMIWQFPLWWFGLPGVLKGWVDRVFAMGRIYDKGRVYADGVLRGRKALLSFTTGAPESAFHADGYNGDIAAILRPIHRGMLEFVGMSVLRPQIVWQPGRLSPEQRKAELEGWAARLATVASEQPIAVGRY